MYKIRFKYVWIVRNFSLNELKDEDFKHSRRVNGYTGQMKIALKKVKVKKWLVIPYIMKITESNFVFIEHTHCPSTLT